MGLSQVSGCRKHSSQFLQLGVRKTTIYNSCLVYVELGRVPLIKQRKLRIFKYWLRLLTTINCILRESYNYNNMVQNNDEWIGHK